MDDNESKGQRRFSDQSSTERRGRARSRVRRRSDANFIEPQTHTGGTAATPRTGTRVIEGDPGSSGQRADEWKKLSSNWNCCRAIVLVQREMESRPVFVSAN